MCVFATGIAKAMVAGVIMIAVILGLIPICCNKFNSKVKTNKQISGRVSTSEIWGSVVLMC